LTALSAFARSQQLVWFIVAGLCHNAKVVHAFEAEVLRKSPGYEIEVTCDPQFSITHAAPPDVSFPAVYWVKVKNRKHPAMERVKDAFA